MNYDLARILAELRDTAPALHALATLPQNADLDDDGGDDV